MITRTHTRLENLNWQNTLADSVTDPAELFEILNLDPDSLPAAHQAHENFKLRIPRSFVAKMEMGNPLDPLLLQALPAASELFEQPAGFKSDPVNDLPASPTPGLIHKYASRVLLISSAGCAINCRYCFRRNYPYSEGSMSRENWLPALEYIAKHKEIEEVILSGGDPLTLPTSRLTQFTRELEKISHIKVLRIHSRLPVVLPERIDEPFLIWIKTMKLRVVMVIHSNHPSELDAPIARVLQSLNEADALVLNQSVILKQVNDCPDVLARLSRRLFECHVQPYYLNMLDKVNGAAHFEIEQDRARALYRDLAERLPGYLLPKLVADLSEKPFKTVFGTG